MNNSKENIWKVGYIVGILLAIFLLVISIKEFRSISYVGRADSYINQISVSGKGEVVAIPDIATFTFSVTETSKVISEVQSKTSEKISKVIKALKDNGVDEKDIKTLSYNINPHYDYVPLPCDKYVCPASKSVLSGYDVSQSIEVKVRDLTKAGKLLEVIGSLDVQNVSGLSFTIDDMDKVKAEARDLAIADAQAKAKELSKKLGVSFVKIVGYYDQSGENQYYAKDGMGGEGYAGISSRVAVPTVEVPQGEQKIVSRISISYEMK